jgi:hypothetical protein
MLGLKLNAQSDPFALADFVSNWGILDASPGVFVCTSVSRPTWGAAQAGRLIFMTDLKQVSYWDGSNWNDPRDSSPVFGGGVFINNVGIGGSGTKTFSVLGFTTPRPCALAIWLTGTYTWPANIWQDAAQNIQLDGVDQMMGGFRDGFILPGVAGKSAAQEAINCSSIAIVPSVTAGHHTIGAKVSTGGAGVTVVVQGFRTIAMMSLYASGNVL